MYLYFCLKKQWKASREILKEGGGGILVCAYHVHLYILTSFHITSEKLCYCENFVCFKIYVYLKDYLLLLTQHYL